MKLFNTLMSTIFGHASAPAAGSAPAQTSSAQTPATPTSAPAASAGAASGSGAASAAASVDVNAVLNEMASKNSEQLDWKKSIVDLMKLVGMDSSLSSRKELAKELGYTGDQADSATMNVWLHKEVLRKLAENGGKVPQNLLD
jgi:3-oxoacyl-ACP reductase-like protein